MNIPTIEPISIGIGAVGVIILFGVIKFVTWLVNRNRGHSLNEMKSLVTGAHEDMFSANEKLAKLYKVFNEVEGELNG